MAAGFLACFGLVAIYSVTLGAEAPNFLNFKKQITFAAVGFILLFLISRFDYRLLKTYSNFLYLLGLLLLLIVLIFGQTIRGTKGWFFIGELGFQPVELIKFILVVFLARYFTSWARRMDQIRHIIISGLGAAVLIFLVILQPDFGSALILVCLWLSMVLIVGIKRSHLLLVLLIFFLITLGAWFLLFQDYQKARLITFFNPGADPLGRGYNITQSVIAVGAGQIFGRGLGFGSQSQLKFLPEAQTDFIFSVIAEELGFWGVTLVLGFWTVIFIRLIRLAKRVRDDFGLFLILGILVLFFIQVFVNIGVSVGLLPVTGISLPLISYGGSSLLVSLLMLGIIESMAARIRTGPPLL